MVPSVYVSPASLARYASGEFVAPAHSTTSMDIMKLHSFLDQNDVVFAEDAVQEGATLVHEDPAPPVARVPSDRCGQLAAELAGIQMTLSGSSTADRCKSPDSLAREIKK